ncbi:MULTISPECIES: hypothetical protein [unclassified Pseudomonas]|uniref:hypothetical protein n=1 Tax=unclassified Pseudomonas TaxID=196821 RepID=UPI00111C2532|nr:MULTISPECIES: hypothetical protein [unclassified Pseudomonas]
MKTVAIGAQAIVGPMKFALNLAANGIMNLAAGEQIEEYKSKAAFNLTVFFTGRNTEEEIKALDASNELAKIEHAKGNKDYPLDGDGQVVASRFLIDAVLGEFKSIGAKAGGRVVEVTRKKSPKGIQKIPGFGEIDDFIASQSTNLNKKLGAKIGEGRLPYERSRAGVEQAKATVKETLENATSVSPLIPSSTVRGGYDLIHVYSSKTNSTVSLRVLPGGKYEFDILIPEKSSRF